MTLPLRVVLRSKTLKSVESNCPHPLSIGKPAGEALHMLRLNWAPLLCGKLAIHSTVRRLHGGNFGPASRLRHPPFQVTFFDWLPWAVSLFDTMETKARPISPWTLYRDVFVNILQHIRQLQNMSQHIKATPRNNLRTLYTGFDTVGIFSPRITIQILKNYKYST